MAKYKTKALYSQSILPSMRPWQVCDVKYYHREIIIIINIGAEGIVYQSVKCQMIIYVCIFEELFSYHEVSVYPVLPCKFPKNVHSLSHTYITHMPTIALGIIFSHISILKECKDVSTRRGNILKVLFPSISRPHCPGEERGSGSMHCCSSY